MTLCIGHERRGRVWIGADSSVRQGDYTCVAIEPKVWRAGDWIVAGAGPWRALNVVRFTAKMPKIPKHNDADRCVEIDVIGSFKRALDAVGFRPDDPDDAKERGGDLDCGWLVGAQGLGLWKIDYDSASRVAEACIGCEAYADGWLDASPFGNPEMRIRECIKAASKRLPGNVRLPVRIIGPESKAA